MENPIQWWDSHHQQAASMDLNELDRQLKGISAILNKHAEDLQYVGQLELSEIDLSLDIKGNVLVVALDGALKLIFKAPSSKPAPGT
jgi:hypothetical protein